MNKTLRTFVSAALCATLVAAPGAAFARGPHRGPPPPRHGPVFHGGPHHHHHHSWHGGDWLGFGLGVGILGAAVAAIASEPEPVVYSTTTYAAPVVAPAPVVVQQPAPVVVQQPAVVAQPVAQTVVQQPAPVVQQPVVVAQPAPVVVAQPVQTTTVIQTVPPPPPVFLPPPRVIYRRPRPRAGFYFGF